MLASAPLPTKATTPAPVETIEGTNLVPELALAEAISLTFQANPDLRAAGERTQIAQETLTRARAEFFPALKFNQQYQASNNPLQKFSFLASQGQISPSLFLNLPPTVDNFHSQLQVQQEIYSGGRRQAQADVARSERDEAHQALAAVRNQLVFLVAEAYYRLFQSRELVKVRREAVELVENQLKEVKARFRAKSAVEADVLEVEVRLAEVREALIAALNHQELSGAILENVTGASLAGRNLPETLPAAPWSNHIERLEATVTEVTQVSAPPAEVEMAVAEAVQRRPEMSEADSRRRAAEYRVQAARTEKHPSLGLIADYDLFTGDFRSGTDTFFIGLAFGLNLCDAGRTRAEVRKATAQVREIIERNTRLRLDIELEVRRASLQLKDARERILVAATAVKSAQERRRQVESRYRNQAATVTQLLDSQVALTDARVRHTSARAEIEIACAALERAIGRLSAFLCPTALTHDS